MEDILAERKGDVIWITLNRPERLNSYGRQTIDEIVLFYARTWMLIGVISRKRPSLSVQVVILGIWPKQISGTSDQCL